MTISVDTVILPPATIAILGGGQLGAMLCEAGRRMGYRMVVLSEEASDLGGAVGRMRHVIGEITCMIRRLWRGLRGGQRC